jgi:hypothetical protein
MPDKVRYYIGAAHIIGDPDAGLIHYRMFRKNGIAYPFTLILDFWMLHNA